MTKHVEIVLDKSPINPYKDWDMLGTIVSWHPDYDIGEKVEFEHANSIVDPMDGPQRYTLIDNTGSAMGFMHAAVSYQLGDAVRVGAGVHLPILMWADGSLNTEHLGCVIGPRLVGYIYVTKDRLKDEALADKPVDKVKEILAAEVKVYNSYHMGDCWGVKVYDNCECCGQSKPSPTDSCWGYYGADLDDTGIVGFVHEIDDTIPLEEIKTAWDKRLDNA